MNKSELISIIAERAGVTKVAAGQVVDALAETITEELKGQGEFTLPGIGKLTLQSRPERPGRNPSTGETVTLAASSTVKFKQSSTLKAAVN